MSRASIKSLHVALAAVGTATAALAVSAVVLAAPDQILHRAYETAISRSASTNNTMTAPSVHDVGSESFWLSKDHNQSPDSPVRSLALGDRFSLPELANAGHDSRSTLEVISVEAIAYAGKSSEVGVSSRLLLITARAIERSAATSIPLTADDKSIVRFVIDADDPASGLRKLVRAL